METGLTDLSEWVKRREVHEEVISPVPLRLLAATLDTPAPTDVPDGEVPLLWHWLYFLPDAPQSELGADGHPRRGGFFPPIPLKRRMFAGGSVQIHRPLRIGRRATSVREIASVEHKEGRSGPLVLVTAAIEIGDDEGPAISETQTIVYTDAVPAAGSDGDATVPTAEWEQEVAPDTVRLFRFSALTFNGHRIHHDAAYATAKEGYRGLVVHGPLTAILLAEMARARGIAGRAFRFHARTPLYAGDVIRLRGNPSPREVALAAYSPSGSIALEAHLSTDG